MTALGAELALSLAELTTGRTAPGHSASHDGPGTAQFDHRGVVCSLDAQADRWLAELTSTPWTGTAAHPMLAPIWSILARARAVATGQERGPASARLRAASGRWLVVHASCLAARAVSLVSSPW